MVLYINIYITVLYQHFQHSAVMSIWLLGIRVRDPTSDIGVRDKVESPYPTNDGGRIVPLLAMPSVDASPPHGVRVQLQVPRSLLARAVARRRVAVALNLDQMNDPPVRTRVVIHSRINSG